MHGPKSPIVIKCCLAFTVLACIIVAGAMNRRARPHRRLVEAARAIKELDPQRAIVLLDLPERVAATRDNALVLHAQAALALKRVPEAAKVLEAADPQGPWATEVGFWRGRILFDAKETLRAITWFRWVLERRPDDTEAHRWLAAASYELGDRPTAIDSLKRVTQVDPKDARAWRTLALLYKEDVDFEQAEPAYAAALKADPAQPAARLEWAETLIKLGRHDRAEEQLEFCRGKVPEGDRADLLAQCFHIRGDEKSRCAMLDTTLAVSPNHPGLLAQRAQIDLFEGQPERALARLDRAVSVDPFDAQRIYQRAGVLRVLGRKDAAERDSARAGELNRRLAEMSALNDQAARMPGDADLRCRIGSLCRELGKNELAASWYRAALACDAHHQDAKFGLKALLEARR